MTAQGEGLVMQAQFAQLQYTRGFVELRSAIVGTVMHADPTRRLTACFSYSFTVNIYASFVYLTFGRQMQAGVTVSRQGLSPWLLPRYRRFC